MVMLNSTEAQAVSCPWKNSADSSFTWKSKLSNWLKVTVSLFPADQDSTQYEG